jgi:Cof subfamily protein (haloacid dehalogenase superfamily)
LTYKLVALDIDGTIRSPERGLSARTRRAIGEVISAGATVTVATGRMFHSALDSTAGLDLTSPIVSFQGAHIAHPTTGEVLWHRPLTEELTRSALDALDDWGTEILASIGDDAYFNITSPWVEGYRERNQGRVHVVGDLTALAWREPSRLVAVGSEDEVRRLEQRLKSIFESRLHITRSLPTFCEILHPDGGKHKALEWLCGHLGIRQDETVAFGNGYNDVDMLRWSGLGVAIGGAVPEVLEVADLVAPPLEEDGAAQVLEDMLRGGLIG